MNGGENLLMVGVAFQELAIVELSRGKSMCVSNGLRLGTQNSMRIGRYDDSDWSSDDDENMDQNKYAEDYDFNCFNMGNLLKSSTLVDFFRVEPTMYCIECVAMISPTASSPNHTQGFNLSTSTAGTSHVTGVTNSTPNSSIGGADSMDSPGGSGNFNKFVSKKQPLIITGLRNWKIWRRYSEFEMLEKCFKSRVGNRVHGRFPAPFDAIPELPPKSYLGRFEEEFLAERCRLLQLYLNEILKCTPLVHSFSEMQLFFGIEECLGEDAGLDNSSYKDGNDEIDDCDEMRENMEVLLMAEDERLACILDEAANLMIPMGVRHFSVEAHQIQSPTARLAIDRHRSLVLSYPTIRKSLESLSKSIADQPWSLPPSDVNEKNVAEILLNQPFNNLPFDSISSAMEYLDSNAQELNESIGTSASRFILRPEDEIVAPFELVVA